jgi:type IV pilus assembly protein PilN
MIRINLLPAAKRQARAQSSGPSGATGWVVGYLGGALVCGVILTVVYTQFAGELRELTARNRALEDEIETLESQTADIDDVRAELEQSRELEEVVAELQRARLGPTRLMIELSHVLSSGGGPTIDARRLEEIRRDNPLAGFNSSWDFRRLWLTEFTEEERGVEIRGLGRTNEDVAELLRRLTLSELFEEIALTRTESTEDSESHLDLIAFEMAGRVRY